MGRVRLPGPHRVHAKFPRSVSPLPTLTSPYLLPSWPLACGHQQLATISITTTTTTPPCSDLASGTSKRQFLFVSPVLPDHYTPAAPMNILNQPIGPAGAHAAFPAAKDGAGMHLMPPASLRFDGPSTARWQAQTLRRASSYVGAGHADEPATVKGVTEQQQHGLVPPFQPVTLNFLRSLLDRDNMTSLAAEDGGEGAGVAAAAPPLHALRVVVSSAVALDARQTELIARKMRRITGFVDLAIENVVEPSLIAGFVVCYGLDDSHTIDLSVRGRLAALKNRVDSSDQDDRLNPRTPAPLH